ncbi:MAG TPA: hypothetical protein QKA08_00735 [Candidatus Megaira endosymbiont of Nemacystus decipiens]|nr:hypothetical protein [Candidatus Megaera endosymbiont of Nemacystus decipiens]
MWIKKYPLYMVTFLCLLTIYSLFYIKEEVLNSKIELQKINTELQREEDKIHILKAELAYLTSPERLKKLNNDYVKLKETKLSQISDDLLYEKKHYNTKQIAQNKPKKLQWRYKKGPTKYVTLVSAKKK